MFFVIFSSFTLSLTVNINEQQYTGTDYSAILQSYGSEVNTIKSIKVTQGEFYISSITKRYTQLATLEIPETSFTGYIQDDQFKDMISLHTVILNGVTSIGSNSFQNCIQLETVHFSSCLTIGNYAFSGCQLLTTANFPKLTTIGAFGFEKAGLIEIELNSAFVFNTKLDILKGLQGCQFSGCTKLMKVTMKSAPLIQRYMFENCNSLISVDMPKCLSIGDRAFIGCNSYRSATFRSVLSIGAYSFYSLLGLTDVSFPFCNSIGMFAFSKCQNLRSASFDFCVTIEEDCFSDCSSLESVNFPSVTKLGQSAFENSGLVIVRMNSLVELETEFELFVGDVGRQFADCSKLKSVTLNSLQTVKSYTFENCEFLSELNLPSCTSIELNGLTGCKNIKKLSLGYMTVNFVAIPNPTILTHIYFPYALIVFDGTFSSLTELTSCRLPMITKIGSNLFCDHHKLTEVLLPRVREIEGESAFSGCESLTLISLQSLKTVNRNSMNLFQGCTNLKYIYLPANPPKTFNSATFQGLTCSIVIPNDSIQIYDNDLSVDGDVANDGKWCGIVLQRYTFVDCDINLLWRGVGFNLHDCVLVSGLSDSDVVHLRIRSGLITQEELNSIKSYFINLKELIIDESVTIENDKIPADFLLNHKDILSITINCNVNVIESSAFEGCSKLRIFKCPKVTELNSRCFYGPTSIESFSFDLVSSLKGSDFFSNNAKLTTIYLPKLTDISVTGFVSQNTPLLASILLPKNPPVVNSGTFLCDSQPNLIGLSNDEAKVYDAADGVNNDMKYYSLNLTYSLITCTIDGRMTSGLTLKGIVKQGNKIVEVLEGEVFESDFQLPSSIVSLTISEKVQIKKIPRNAMSHNTNLKSVTILSKNALSIEEEAFSGCTSLEYVLIDSATVLNGLAFKGCTSLKTVVLDQVQEIAGNFNFDGCIELRSISLKSLTKIQSQSSLIFNGCTKLTTIKLPSSPPSTFNKDSFAGIQNHVTLSLPSEGDYKTYDNDIQIDGDVANDGYWCGILLPTDTIIIQLNDQNNPIYGKSLDECISLSGIVESEIKSLEILKGTIQVSSFISTIKKLEMLENLFVSNFVLLSGDFTDGMFSGLDLVSINLPHIETIPANFFQNCQKLKRVVIDDATKICSSAFYGCISLESISLNVETLEGDSHFEGCTSLSVINLRNLKIVDQSSTKIFLNCPLKSIYLPYNPPKTFNKNVFENKNILIQGLTESELDVYDLNIDIEGDAAYDFKWCGIDLIQLYILVSIDQRETVYSKSLTSAASSSTISQVKSIEIRKGMVKKFHLNELKQFTSLTSFKVSKEAFLESSIIDNEQFKDMTNLVEFSIIQNVTLMNNCFMGCTSLIKVEFDSVYSINEGSFKGCSSLKSISIPNCKKLNGDEIFSGCSKLESIDLSSLEKVDSSSSRIFEGCFQLKSIYLPSKEPSEFNKDTFKSLSNIKLILPAYDDYVIYDDDSNVKGDVELDGKWCGIQIDSNNLPPLLTFKINGNEYKRREITNIGNSRSLLLENNDDNTIETLELINGVFDPTLVKESINKNKLSIEKFEVEFGTLNEILTGTFYGCDSLTEIIIHNEIKIGLNAFQHIPNLMKISLDLQQTLRSDEFKGDINLQEISLPLLTTIPSSLFSNLLNLKTVNLNSSSTMLDGCFRNCISLTNIELPRVSLIAGDSHFENCNSLEKVDLSGLKTVNQTAANIFNNCNHLTRIKLGNEPPNLFNENIFVNSGVVPNISIPNPSLWNNYIPQCTIDVNNNHYLWYGYDIGLEKVKERCPKDQKTTVICLAVFTAIFGVGCIVFVIIMIVSCCSYDPVCGFYP